MSRSDRGGSPRARHSVIPPRLETFAKPHFRHSRTACPRVGGGRESMRRIGWFWDAPLPKNVQVKFRKRLRLP